MAAGEDGGGKLMTLASVEKRRPSRAGRRKGSRTKKAGKRRRVKSNRGLCLSPTGRGRRRRRIARGASVRLGRAGKGGGKNKEKKRIGRDGYSWNNARRGGRLCETSNLPTSSSFLFIHFVICGDVAGADKHPPAGAVIQTNSNCSLLLPPRLSFFQGRRRRTRAACLYLFFAPPSPPEK